MGQGAGARAVSRRPETVCVKKYYRIKYFQSTTFRLSDTVNLKLL
jgi:hypothetical protein